MPNDEKLIPVSGRQLAAVGAAGDRLPTIFLRSPDAEKRFWEFFTANIRNRNIRKAYFVAVSQFSDWCESKKLSIHQVEPVHVAAYVELMMQAHSKPTVKHHLAAIRMLFDWLVTGQVLNFSKECLTIVDTRRRSNLVVTTADSHAPDDF